MEQGTSFFRKDLANWYIEDGYIKKYNKISLYFMQQVAINWVKLSSHLHPDCFLSPLDWYFSWKFSELQN